MSNSVGKTKKTKKKISERLKEDIFDISSSIKIDYEIFSNTTALPRETEFRIFNNLISPSLVDKFLENQKELKTDILTYMVMSGDIIIEDTSVSSFDSILSDLGRLNADHTLTHNLLRAFNKESFESAEQKLCSKDKNKEDINPEHLNEEERKSTDFLLNNSSFLRDPDREHSHLLKDEFRLEKVCSPDEDLGKVSLLKDKVNPVKEKEEKEVTIPEEDKLKICLIVIPNSLINIRLIGKFKNITETNKEELPNDTISLTLFVLNKRQILENLETIMYEKLILLGNTTMITNISDNVSKMPDDFIVESISDKLTKFTELNKPHYIHVVMFWKKEFITIYLNTNSIDIFYNKLMIAESYKIELLNKLKTTFESNIFVMLAGDYYGLKQIIEISRQDNPI